MYVMKSFSWSRFVVDWHEKEKHTEKRQYNSIQKGWHLVVIYRWFAPVVWKYSPVILPREVIISTAVRAPLLDHVYLTVVRWRDFAAVVVVVITGRRFGIDVISWRMVMMMVAGHGGRFWTGSEHSKWNCCLLFQLVFTIKSEGILCTCYSRTSVHNWKRIGRPTWRKSDPKEQQPDDRTRQLIHHLEFLPVKQY